MSTTDQFVVDRIALYLGTADEWNGADALDWIADEISTVRPHPGDTSFYRDAFEGFTKRDSHDILPSGSCRPKVYNNKFAGDRGYDAWTWDCDCHEGEFAGLHYERLDAFAEAYAHKLGEF